MGTPERATTDGERIGPAAAAKLVTAAGAELRPVARPGEIVTARLEDFMNPQIEMAVDEQLWCMEQDFYGQHGVAMPRLTDSEKLALAAAIDIDKRRRIIPFLMAPKPELEIPEAVLNGQQVAFETLLYETAQGKLLTRSAYVEDLRDSGKALETAEGAWLFPIIDLPGNSSVANGATNSLVPAPSELLIIAYQVLPKISGNVGLIQRRYTANERLFSISNPQPISTDRPKIRAIIGLEREAGEPEMCIKQLQPIGDNDLEMLLVPLFTERTAMATKNRLKSRSLKVVA